MSKTYENIRKIATGKGDDYTTGCLLDYPYFKENYKMIAIDLSRQNELDAEPRASKRNSFRIFSRCCKSFVNMILSWFYLDFLDI